MDKAIIDRIKHIETFYEQAPPGMVKEQEELPEECIPDTEQNQAARDFLAKAPTKGLWMPLGKEVKVMQCWRCKNYGHRTGDRECPLFESGNEAIEKFRAAHEDPMFEFMNSQKKQEQKNKLLWLQSLLDKESSSDGESSSESRDRGSKKKKKKKTRSKEKELWVERALSSNSASAADSSRSLGKKSKKHHKEKKNRKKDQRQRSSPLRKDHKDKKKRRKDGDNCPSSSPESSHKSKHKRPKR